MNRPLKIGLAYFFFTLAGIITLLLGIVCPFYFRGTAPSLIQKSGENTKSLTGVATDLVNVARISPIFDFNVVDDRIELNDRSIDLAQKTPSYFFTGGAAPYIEEIVRRFDLQSGNYTRPPTVVELFTPRPHRDYVYRYLSRSRNANVSSLLESRNIKGTLIFSPVDSPSGPPLDIAILTTALLVQAEEFPRGLASEISRMSDAAMDNAPGSLERLESFHLAILTLAKRFQWVSLAELTRKFQSIDSILQTAAMFRDFPEDKSLIFSAVILSEKPDTIFEFVELYREEALVDLNEAIQHGRGSIELLLERMSPIYRPTAWNRSFDSLQNLILKTPLYPITISHPRLAGILKLLSLVSAGLCFVIILRMICSGKQPSYRSWLASVLANAGNLSLSLAFAICVWLALEPEFLKQNHASPPPPMNIQFAAANPFENLKSDIMNQMEIDQVTLLILGLFFIFQVAIYAYARVRLHEIKKIEATPTTKLKLIENEDNLFDSGLYVGLGGTVSSLIMLALSIVEASLMAAYASTLFGIIFVAVLKIFNVRPYRNQLILQMEEEGKKPEPPQRELKLK